MIKFKVKVMLAMRDMTQKELAERTGIRPPTVSAICTGAVKHLPVEALDKICEVLDCQPADLMEYVKEPVQQNSCFPERRRRLQKQQKKTKLDANFVQGITATILWTSPVYFGKNIFSLAVSNLGWATLPLNGGFNPEDGAHVRKR